MAVKCLAPGGHFLDRVAKYFGSPPTIREKSDPISQGVAEWVLKRLTSVGCLTQRIWIDVGIQCFASCIAIVEEALRRKVHVIIATNNAPAAIYAAVRGNQFVLVDFFGNTFDRFTGALKDFDFPPEVVAIGTESPALNLLERMHKEVIAHCELIVQGAFYMSLKQGIGGSPDYRSFHNLRSQQIQKALERKDRRSVVIPADWWKLSPELPPLGNCLLTSEALKEKGKNIVLFTRAPNGLEVAGYAQTLTELEREGGVDVKRIPVGD